VAGTGAIVASTTPTSELRTAIDQHVVIFIYTLTALAVLMGIVGLLGLASSMSITVVERRGEYGIMQAIGATPGTVRRLILAEGVLSGFLGAIAGVLIGLPLSIVVGDFLGRISFGLPLPFEVSVGGVLLWLGLVVAGAVAATLTAAYRAGRLTVRETLAYQ
jgi:putative ABC transport system permease protein